MEALQLRVPGGYLSPGQDYLFQVSTWREQYPNLISKTVAWVSVKWSPIVALIAGAEQQHMAWDGLWALDATASYDPDQSDGRREFTWSYCRLEYGSAVQCQVRQPRLFAGQVVLVMPAVATAVTPCAPNFATAAPASAAALQNCQRTSEEVGLFFGSDTLFCATAQGCRFRMSFFFRLFVSARAEGRGVYFRVDVRVRRWGSPPRVAFCVWPGGGAWTA